MLMLDDNVMADLAHLGTVSAEANGGHPDDGMLLFADGPAFDGAQRIAHVQTGDAEADRFIATTLVDALAAFGTLAKGAGL
jgi:hypothetical protein